MAKELNPEEKQKAVEWLSGQFDKIFNKYCTNLRAGIPITMFTEDTEDNRLLMEEFRNNYLSQRAALEGWEYKPENFKIVYTNETEKLTYNPTIFFNPKEQNLGFEEVGGKSGLFVKLKQKISDRIRNNLQAILNKQSK